VFKTGMDFIRFAEDVRTDFRYVHSEHVHEFLESLVASSVDRTQEFLAKSRLWRAQLGCDTRDREAADADITVIYPEDVPFHRERMKPRPHAEHEGSCSDRNASNVP
jgi:hypothetical protein